MKSEKFKVEKKMQTFNKEINDRSQLPRNVVNCLSLEIIKSRLFEEAGGLDLRLTGALYHERE